MPSQPIASFPSFFTSATGNDAPFDYQIRLACGERDSRADAAWHASGSACASRLIDVPTGCGKTAAVVLAWLWNRVAHPNPAHRATWPRRLAFCLPMRTLVEQTEGEVKKWLLRLYWHRRRAGINDEATARLRWLALHSPVVLMGGEEPNGWKKEWDVHPEREAILIGTQDMLLSRALNRGYGMNRYRWPMHFGLLNNDALWIMDETQLMGVGVETSAQLDGFRHQSKLGAPTHAFTWWMSATLSDAQLATVDHPKPPEGWPVHRLDAPDLAPGAPARVRREAVKRLYPAGVKLGGEDKADAYVKRLAGFIREKHQDGTLTLVVLNRVSRARDVYRQLSKEGVGKTRLALIHSRFRPDDRRKHEEVLFAEDGTDRIVIATQAVEAGVDVSARVLITELAPWPSLVQRFGRCNRRGEWNDRDGADVFWIDLRPKDEKDEVRFPYDLPDFDEARKRLESLTEASPRALAGVAYDPPVIVRSVIRRKDLRDLFDTTPDLLGHDLDISRYVRDGEDTDVQVFWREVPADQPAPPLDEPDATRPEICRVSLGDMRKFLKKKPKPRAFVWDALHEEWIPAGEIARPGQTYLLTPEAGGYDDKLGWTGEPLGKGSVLTPLPPPPDDRAKQKGYGGNEDTFLRYWLRLDQHTREVAENVAVLADALALGEAESAALHDAALWHDLGKAHIGFQQMLRAAVRVGVEEEACPDPAALWAKSAGRLRKRVQGRDGFRHELASALAWLQSAPAGLAAERRDLTAFLIAAHHGKVRLSIRSLPDESPVTLRPDEADRLHARGIWDGEWLPAENAPDIQLNGLVVKPLPLDLGYMKMGDDENGRGPSWLARMVALRDSPALGPFRLAYLETLLRAADGLASAGKLLSP